METSHRIFELCEAMANVGNPNSVSDAGVGALCARAAIHGAFLNVKINASGLDDKKFAKDVIARGKKLALDANKQEQAIMKIVEGKL